MYPKNKTKMYECKECNYKTYHRGNYNKHIKTKGHHMKKMNEKSQPKVNIFDPKCSKKSTESQHLIEKTSKKCTQILDDKEVVKATKKTYNCDDCDFVSRFKQSYYRHINNCKNKKEQESIEHLKELVELLNSQLEKQQEMLNTKDEEIKMLIKKVGLNTTHNTIIETQNNIQLLGYKNTDYSHLTDEDYKQCISHINLSVPHLLQKVHFNKSKPENHNIYISNLKNKYIMIFNGNRWITRNRDEEIEEMLDNGNTMLEYKIEDWLQEGKQYPIIMKKFERYIKNIENDNVLSMIKDEIKLLLYNNRNIPQINLK